MKRRCTGALAMIEALAVQAPISCADSPTPALPIDVEVVSGPVAVDARGDFSAGAIRHGSGTVVSGRVRGSRVTFSYRHASRMPNAYDGGTETCDTGTLRLTAAPGHRPELANQPWHGQTATGEPVAFNVAAGGRVLQAPARTPANGTPAAAIAVGAFSQSCFSGGCSPSSTDICAYETPVTLFVAADGRFGNGAWQEGDQALVTGRFSEARRARGTFTNGGEGCPPTSWTAGAG